ncbi:MAG TPA: serine hydrolase domain-containing protein [Longimicrobiales bacterium]|nr:serine hydrolase domain-containing protein [Longimicrobiales bacterium]
MNAIRSLRDTRVRLSALTLALALALVPAPGSAQATAAQRETRLDVPASIDSARVILQSFLGQRHVPGLTAAVAVDGALVWTQGFGYADLEHMVPASPQTRWRIASISKTFTAVAAMQLLAQGKLDLDAPIQRWVPEFPPKRGPVTLRRLMSHTSGLRHYKGDEFMSDVHYDDVIAPIAVFAQDSLLFMPGERYSYSTYGFTLVSAVVRRASGEPFLDYLEEHVIRPAGLSSVGPERKDSIILHHASFYLADSLGVITKAPEVDLSNKWAGGGLLSTASDLVRWALAVSNHRVLSDSMTERMWTRQKLNDGTLGPYALGWRVETDAAGHRVVYHTGGAMGGGGVLYFYPDDGVAVAILGNLPIGYLAPARRIGELLEAAEGAGQTGSR